MRRLQTVRWWVLALVLAWVGEASLAAAMVNVRDLGARGDGIADDTAAFQKAFDSGAGNQGAKVLIPAGRYRITKTLVIEKKIGCLIQGEGGLSINNGNRLPNSILIWDGEPGGTLLKTIGMADSVIRDLSFDGGQKAGILFLATTVPGWGNMINRLSNVSFLSADTGIQMGQTAGEHNCSDYSFDYITFTCLKTGLKVVNDQGVDFLFNFIFALGCDRVLDFAHGGNVLVNNAQMTNCGLFLNIDGGGRNCGTYIANNVRIESDNGGLSSRYQLLRSHPSYRQANVKFTGYTDAQWAWSQNQTPQRTVALCDIGPGTLVTFENSIFNSPVARLTGDATAAAILTVRNCHFGFVTPENAVAANEHGFFRFTDNVTDSTQLLPDLVKWPVLKPNTVGEATYSGKALTPTEPSAASTTPATAPKTTK